MNTSHYLDAKAFLREAEKLKVSYQTPTEDVLERLEEQRLLFPRLRLRYPDEIARRWFAEDHPDEIIVGPVEPDGPRWSAACDLENSRKDWRWGHCKYDPTTTPFVLDAPESRFLQFIENLNENNFIPWSKTRVLVSNRDGSPLYISNAVVNYYSSWQVLQFSEVANMGVFSFINIVDAKWPYQEEMTSAPQWVSFIPAYALKGFATHASVLNGIVWYAQKVNQGYGYATGLTGSRRLITDKEREEISRIEKWSVIEAKKNHNLNEKNLLEAIRFLCEQWVEWNRNGRPLIANAYKEIAKFGIRLGCAITNASVDDYAQVVGRVGGYFKPIVNVIWPDWALEQREYAKRVLIGFNRERAILKAEFNEELIDRFLDFVEAENLHGFYWRLKSFHDHTFNGNRFSLEGLKGDVQGMSVVLEHIASALGGEKTQLIKKFKQLWQSNQEVIDLLKDNKATKVGYGETIDLDWFKERNGLSFAEQTVADLVISYAIRGGVHRDIDETNPLNLELMMFILLRAAVKTFQVAKGQGQNLMFHSP